MAIVCVVVVHAGFVLLACVAGLSARSSLIVPLLARGHFDRAFTLLRAHPRFHDTSQLLLADAKQEAQRLATEGGGSSRGRRGCNCSSSMRRSERSCSGRCA